MENKPWTLLGPTQDFLSAVDVSHYLKVSIPTLRRMIRAGQFPRGQRLGNRMSWSGADVAAYLQLRGRLLVSKKLAGDQKSTKRDQKPS
jgi:predicted DNA-binding transcriptional regulator AlpA